MRHPAVLAVLSMLVALLAGCGGTVDLFAGGTGGPGPGAVEDAVARLSAEELEDWGCGHGFTLGTTDQQVRLSLWSADGAEGPPAPGTHELGEAWTGQLVVGRDLFAQWCDDVMEADEPEVVETGFYQVTGTLTWSIEDGPSEAGEIGCPTVATGSLTDAAVIVDGQPVELGEVDLRNDFFGCFAG